MLPQRRDESKTELRQAVEHFVVFSFSGFLQLIDFSKLKTKQMCHIQYLCVLSVCTRERCSTVGAARSGSIGLILWQLSDGEGGLAGVTET